MPTSEDLLILINGTDVTSLINFETITITNERGKRVSTCQMVVDNAASLGIAQWQNILIYSTDFATVHFNGYIMTFRTTKRGIYVDYDIDCSSVEVLLSNSVINGDYTGTDADILGDILSNGYPDLSDLFDFSSGVTPLSLSDLNIDFQDLSMLDALDALSAAVGGADFSVDPSQTSGRINMAINPQVDSITGYGSTIPADSNVGAGDKAAWLPSNTVYDAAGGETGGGMKMTSQFLSDFNNYGAFMRVGRATDSDPLPFSIKRADNAWISIDFRFMWTGPVTGSSFGVNATLVTYNTDGTVYHNGQNLTTDKGGVTPSTWYSFTRSIDISDTNYVPDDGYFEIYIQIAKSGAGVSFVAYLDSFLVERTTGATEPDPTGTYFDGDSADSYWTGATDNSTSGTPVTLGDNPLTWGSKPDAAFDLDLGNMSELVSDFQYDYNGDDGINSVVVTGGYSWTAVDWEYPANAQQTHFDLEVTIYPMDTIAQPVIYTNIGSDVTPNWSTKTVATRSEGFSVGNVLYDLERHWLEFQDVPPDLKRAFRVVGRIKEPIRVIVQNEASIAATGVEMTDVLYVDTLQSDSAAFDLGQSELARRAPGASGSFTTYEPGLIAGSEIDIVDSLQSISETNTVIERVTRTYLGGGKGMFTVEWGRYSAGLEEVIGESYQKTKPVIPAGTDTTTYTMRILTDDDGAQLTDDDGLILADIGP